MRSQRRHALAAGGRDEAQIPCTGAATGLAVVVPPSVAAAQTALLMGGRYANVTPIPVDDRATKAIADALSKPEGAGPFPAVVYIFGCYGLGLWR